MMASHLIKRMRQRERAPFAGVLAAGLPLRRKQLALARAIRTTVLPQELWLESGASRLGITAAWRRIYGISLRVPEGDDIDLRIPDIPESEQPRIAAILHGCIRQFLDQPEDILQGTELLAEEFPCTGGLPAAVVLRGAARPRPVPSKPALHLVASEPSAGVPSSMAEVVARLQAMLGSRLLLVWMPGDSREMAQCLDTLQGEVAIRPFRPQELGRILRDRP